MYGCSVRLNTCLTRARDLRVRLGPAIKAEPVCREELAYVSFETLKLRTDRGSGSSLSLAEFRALAPVSRRRRSSTAKGHHKWYQIRFSSAPRCSLPSSVPAQDSFAFPANSTRFRRKSFRSRRPSPTHRLLVGGGHRHSTVSAPAPSST